MDPYELCPCGSRKKIKFCCHALYGEMEKVTRLQENNQPRMALQLLEKLDKTHPDNPWVVTRTAMLLLGESRSAEAEAVLRGFLRKHQDHVFANVLYGIAAYGAAGYPEAKRAIHRAFRIGSADYPEFVASLATDVGLSAIGQGHALCARQHLALALRWSDAEQRKSTFRAIYELDGNQSIPYVLRGPQPLPAGAPPEGLQEAVGRAQQLSSIGCWHEAADHLTTATAGKTPSAELSHAIGLYRAWDGAEDAAAAALHQAAAAYGDFETAVDCETLAQLLERSSATGRPAYQAHQFDIVSVAKLLTQLDAAPRLLRLPITEEDTAATGGALTARYMVLDREQPAESSALSLATAPRSLGAVTVFSGENPEGPAGVAVLSVEAGAKADAVSELFKGAAGDAIKPDGKVEELPPGPAELDFSELFETLYFDEGARNPDVIRVIQEQWEQTVREKWPQTPLAALGGKSPRDAAGVPELRVALAGAINVLDAVSAQRGMILDVAALRSELQLPALAMTTAEAGTNVSMLSFAQSLRIDLPSLSTQQLEQLTQRALLMRHPGFAHKVLTYVVERDDAADAAQKQMYYLVLSQISDDAHRSDESLGWIARGLASVPEGPHRFEQLARWKMRELATRSNVEPGPELDAVLVELWHTYAVKLPGLREMLAQTVQTLGISAPWETAIVTAGDLSAATSESWSPVGAAAGGEKKLWLPGDR